MTAEEITGATPKKVSTSERGHARNHDNFKKLAAAVKTFVGFKLPSGYDISVLEAILAAAAPADAAVYDTLTTVQEKIDVRKGLFNVEAKKRVRRMMRYAGKVSKIPADIVANLRTTANNYLGYRALPKTLDNPNTPENEAGNSSSHQSYPARYASISLLIEQATSRPEWLTDEPDLTAAALDAFKNELNTANDDVINAVPLYKNALGVRNNIYYADETGMVDVAIVIKNLVALKYGEDSPEYAQIKNLKFENFAG